MEAGLGALVREYIGPLPLIPAEQTLLDLERARMRAADHESLFLRTMSDSEPDEDSEEDSEAEDEDPEEDAEAEDEPMVTGRVFLVGDRVRVSPTFGGYAELRGASGTVTHIDEDVTVNLDASVPVIGGLDFTHSPHNFEHLRE